MALWLYGYGIAHNICFDRKITAAPAPTHEVPNDRLGVNKEEQDGEENKQVNTIEAPSTDRYQKWCLI